MVAFLSSWPWENLGNLKYLLYGPLIANVVYARMYEETPKFNWCLHILILCALRGAVYTLCSGLNHWHFLTRRRRVVQQTVDFKQIDSEWHWDNFILLHAFMGLMATYTFPVFTNLPIWNSKGYLFALLLHIAVVEPLYYFVHMLLHSDYLFTNYHSLHHSSVVPQTLTAGLATPLEHIIFGLIMGIPILATCLLGYGSLKLIYGYVLIFDFLKCLGHGYTECVPPVIFEFLPFLKYLIYTPTYHYLHRKEMNTNFCLFMPLYDALGNTLNKKSWELHKKIFSGENTKEPDFVFLMHCVDVISSIHVPFVLRSFVSLPYTTRLFLFPLWPLAFATTMLLWMFGKAFLVMGYTLRGRVHQSWCVPRYGFQYFLPFAKNGINDQIEDAILKADKLGVKVISLAALNKNEALNGGGTLFVKKLPDLRVRVTHGNTLTAAVILSEIPKEVKEVFLTGATSKLGRAIALYLCRRGVRVMMLTKSTERFQSIQNEAAEEHRSCLVQVTKFQAAQHCKTWVVGKWITPREQRWAPSGTHFNQFVVPSILEFRRDCTYGKLAAMKLPEDVQGLGTCEYTMDRGVVHACHAGGVVHFLEGYKNHEVGTIDVDMIDVVWEAAMKHGLRPV
ncbi:hypothetical protein AQUCO_01600391v1 [Aquilegia coerulea]|uniref:Fatty acid hydroxylase domain-containing protein n=2 Tax=Aquilegia coerulea TaxID=218851 RepID=A0A2G5DRD7_AQUCA|nr:hypothetical protein AQUCO_01600391v1 [Aquilegia coerulea]